MSEEEKWEEEARVLSESFSPNLSYRYSFKEGYLQACKVRQEEIEKLREEIERLSTGRYRMKEAK